MKKLLLLLLLCLALDASVNAQTQSVSIVSSPVFKFFEQGSNWLVCPFGIYDKTTKTAGGGIAAAYKASQYLVPVLRLDVLNGGAYIPSGALQLQVPVTLFGKLTITPFAFSAVATAANNQKGVSGDVIGIFGTGASVALPENDKWYLPDYVVADYERWTGSGFNDDQYRLGLVWKF